MGSACGIAASMYEKGQGSQWNGKHNIRHSIPKDLEKAEILYRRACNLGEIDDCKKADNLAKLRRKNDPPLPLPLHQKPYGPTLRCDVNGDGHSEKLLLFESRRTQDFTLYRMGILDEYNHTIWRGPNAHDLDWVDPFVFYILDGERMPLIFDDIDGDGRCELIVLPDYSELDLIFYDRFRWNGNGFDQLPAAVLRQQNPPNGGHFVWEVAAPKDRMYTHWFILEMQQKEHGMAEARVVKVFKEPNNSTSPREGKALIRFTPDGADLVRWIKSPPPPPNPMGYGISTTNTNGGMGATGRSNVQSYGGSDGYQAYIGSQDHYNSRGRRLQRLRDILRQDRYYYYRYGGDMGDTSDPYGFGSKRERRFFEWAKIAPVNTSWQHLKSLVRYGSPLLNIQRRGNTLYVTVVREN